MSSDSAKENASVVDSSLTEWKHDMGNSDDPEKHMPVLQNSGRVILIYSVNMSGFFQGYAQMISSVGWRHDNLWNEGSGKSNPWGRSFKVKWLQLNDLPFQKTLHLKNPLNDYKPVKISRDCQELPEDIGEALCELIDGERDADGIVKSFPRDDLPMKRPCIDPSTNTGDGEYTVPPMQVPWGRTPLPYPSFLYQQHDEASRSHFAHQGFTGVGFTDNARSCTASKVARMQQSRNTTNLRIHCEMPSRTDIWGLSAGSPLASTLTDDDFLEMTYEEYLEVHSRSIKRLNPPAAGSSQTTQEPSRSKKHNDDIRLSFITDQGRARKRSHSHNSSEK
ncbi:hypothetical protein SADUNF_Sadunf01G0090100 [Salix dunnii]|uniref:YTH domain-containing family protein n=1 Tax=Salix dunnii TaxID=1413687 RepID=A0A835TLY9_9ROSI|nr:hypothetical protein SADUNF_Sadunf01G0090100 [Salix dunnii]